MIPTMEIRDKIAALRKKKDWSQRDLAKELGVSFQTVQQWEAEGGTHPRPARLPAIAKALGISVSKLISDDSATGASSPTIKQIIDKLELLTVGDLAIVHQIVTRLAPKRVIRKSGHVEDVPAKKRSRTGCLMNKHQVNYKEAEKLLYAKSKELRQPVHILAEVITLRGC